MQVDKRLIQACIAKKRTAQRQLYDLLLPYLRAVACRYLKDASYAKDALQESFIKIFRNIEKFDLNKAPIKAWASKIVVNTCLNYNQRIIGEATEEFSVERHEDGLQPVVFADASDDRLLELLKKMPSDYLEIFNLFVIDGYSHKEISKIKNISMDVSRKKVSRAKSWLKKFQNNIILI